MDKYKRRNHVREILALAVPASLTMMITILVEVLNLVIIARLEDEDMLAGVGMGNMTQNLLGLSIILGFNSTLDTLISRGAGTGDIELCGVYLNRGRFVMCCLFVPICITLCNCKVILVTLRQDEQVSEYAQSYVRSFLPGLFLMGLGDI